MSKKSKSKKIVRTVRRVPVTRKSASRQSFADIVDTVVARLDLVPDYIDLIERDGMEKLIEAAIPEYCNEPTLKELRSSEQRDADEGSRTVAIRRLVAGEPVTNVVALGQLLARCSDTDSTIAWLREEIVYALGVGVGQRMRGVR